MGEWDYPVVGAGSAGCVLADRLSEIPANRVLTSCRTSAAAATCARGPDDEAVTDLRLRVRGVAGLRVVDASIMPALTSGNTNAPTIMVGERGADLILTETLEEQS